MEKLFELTFQDQTLNPQVGTFTDASQATGTFTLEDGEYYLTNADTKGFYAYAPIAIQPDSGTDNRVTVEFDLKVVTASVNTHTIIGTYAGVDGSGIPTGAKITLQYNSGDIELVLGSGTTETLIAAADVVVDQWYHFCIDCALAPTESTYGVKIDGVSITTVTGATTDYELGIIGVLGTDLHACDECGIKNIRLITDDDYFVGRTALNQALRDTKGYIDTQVGACIPRAGGAVFTGAELSRVNTTGCLIIRGGTSETNGSSIELYGKDFSTSYFIGRCRIAVYDGTTGCNLNLRHNGEMYWGGTSFFPEQDNNCECGRSTNRWSVVYAASGTINTSDSRLKNSIKDIDDKLLNAWGNIEPKQYKFNDATEKKGEKARFHTGYLAQDIQTECEKQGVNASDYGLFCYDEWEEQEEISEEIETEKDGKIVKEKRVIQPRREKGNSYALRYEEALVVECKYLRRCIARLTARIEQLEKDKEQEASK